MTLLRRNSRSSCAGQLAGLDHPAVRQGQLRPPRSRTCRPRRCSRRRARCRCPSWRRAGSARRSRSPRLPPPDSVPMIDAPPPMSEPSPTTTPAEIRPSTIDVPSVPALKLTKPSCITVVPSARWAPSRTRSASAIRTPARDHVVDHPGELVHPVHRDRAVGEQPQPGPLEVLRRGRSGRGPDHVGQQAEDAVQVRPVRADQPGESRCSRRYASGLSAGGAARSVDLHRDGPPGTCPAGRRRRSARRARAARAPAGRRPSAGAGIPDVEDPTGVGDGGQAVAPRAAGHPTSELGTAVP